jgi:hypothetical protein
LSTHRKPTACSTKQFDRSCVRSSSICICICAPRGHSRDTLPLGMALRSSKQLLSILLLSYCFLLLLLCYHQCSNRVCVRIVRTIVISIFPCRASRASEELRTYAHETQAQGLRSLDESPKRQKEKARRRKSKKRQSASLVHLFSSLTAIIETFSWNSIQSSAGLSCNQGSPSI